jgi:hypothetical protein
MDMMKLEHLQLEIDALADDEFAQLRRWIADRDWERWDEQLEADAELGKLDFLFDEASQAIERVACVSFRCIAQRRDDYDRLLRSKT